MDKIRPEIRTFALGTIGLSTATWNIAFNLGAYRTVFYNHIFLVWVTVTAIFLVTVLVSEQDVPVPWWGKLLMLVPTLSVILIPFNETINETEITNGLVISLGTFAFLICLPYAIYVAVNVLNADLLELPETRSKDYLTIIVLIVGLLGFWVGANNRYFLNCGDFEIAGDSLPENCQPGPPIQF